MKYFLKLLYTLTLLCFLFSANGQNWSQERTVRAQAVVDAATPQITLQWESSSYSTGYTVYKRLLDAESWGTALVSLGANDSQYIDNDVQVNTRYEYRIVRNTTINEPYSSTGAKLEAYGVLACGIQLEPVHFRGNVLLLVHELHADFTSNSAITKLEHDLKMDGYTTHTEEIADDAEVGDVVAAIQNYEDLTFIYLIGQVPYPYSGLYCQAGNDYEYPPDGHHETAGGHCGAWIADAYYGSLDQDWTDEDSTTNASRSVNDNEIGDGKFDNMQLPGPVSVQVGRIDLSRLSDFSETEEELMTAYLNRASDYKHAEINFLREGIIENNFAAFQEGFSSGAVRDFYGHLGPGKTVNADLFNTTNSANYLFSYTCGAGSYTACNGVGTTSDFTTKNPAIFNHMFGSFFGDFDINNNILRASLASGTGLITAWSGRPKWVTHGLAIGENYGGSALRSQNNDWDYDLSFYQNYAHIALLGDPSLRTNMFAPVSQLNASLNGAKTQVNLKWNASTASGITGYYIYWAPAADSNYYLLNALPISDTSYTHYTPINGSNFYMVRAERLETTASASYYNLSIGIELQVDGVERTAGIAPIASLNWSVYPNPAQASLTVRSTSHEPTDAQLLNSAGQVVQDLHIYDGCEVNIQDLSQGVYFIKTAEASLRFIKL